MFRAVLMWLGLFGTVLLIVVTVNVARSLVGDARTDGESILVPLVLTIARIAVLVAFAIGLVAKIKKHPRQR